MTHSCWLACRLPIGLRVGTDVAAEARIPRLARPTTAVAAAAESGMISQHEREKP